MPDVEHSLTGYTFTWPDENLIIKVSGVRSHTDGRLTGVIKLLLGKNQQEEPSFTFNFSADRSRKMLVNSLSEKYPDWKDKWLTIVDELSLNVQELAAAGEPVLELDTSDDIKPPRYLLEPILFEGLPTIIFGEKGVTKSYMSLVFYVCLTLPWLDNPFGFVVPDKSTKTVILDWELPGPIAQWNLKKLVEGQGLGGMKLYHRHCSRPLADDIEQIQKYIKELGAEVVIIDSLGRAAGGDLSKDTENATRFFNALDKLNVTSLIVAQTSKDTKSKQKSIYGSVYFTYYARSIFELCKADDVGGDEANIAMFHRYCNLSKIHNPMGFRFKFSDNFVRVDPEAVTYNDFLDKINTQSKILEVLRDKPMDNKEIAVKLEVAEGGIRVAAMRLKNKGKIVKLPDNKWGLAANQPDY